MTVIKALQMDVFNNCRLLTGHAGLNNQILWVNILELLDDLSHIEPGEFLITTAHDLNNHSIKMQQHMVELFAEKELAAIAIQTGHYLKNIPSSFILLMEKNKIPLIEIPPGDSFKNITRALLNELISINQLSSEKLSLKAIDRNIKNQANNMKKLWQELITTKKPEELWSDLGNYNIIPSEPFLVLAINIYKLDSKISILADSVTPVLFEQIEQAATQILIQGNIPFMLGFSEHNIIIFIQHHNTANELINTVNTAKCIFGELKLSFPNHIVKIGASRIYNELSCLKKAQNEAEKALKTTQLGLLSHANIIHYGKIGLYSLIMDINNMDTLKTIYCDTVAPLVDYDQHKGGALIPTLKVFLQSANMKKTSEALFIHRQTMRYRLKQIKELTGFDPAMQPDALQLNLGLHVYLYLKSLKVPM